MILFLISSVFTLSPPIWPHEFNATLYKIGDSEDPSKSYWVKLYYKYEEPRFAIQNGAPHVGGGYSRFDFYNHYLNLQNSWNVVCSIYFYSNAFYFTFPDNKCSYRGKIGNISPNWLQTSVFNGTKEFRGMLAEEWLLKAGPDTIRYYSRASPDRTPLRSTNQADDPGATDYFDFIEGPQSLSTFSLPKSCYCKSCLVDRACPLENLFSMEALLSIKLK